METKETNKQRNKAGEDYRIQEDLLYNLQSTQRVSPLIETMPCHLHLSSLLESTRKKPFLFMEALLILPSDSLDNNLNPHRPPLLNAQLYS